MSDATPVPSKPWWQSKTVILNLVALVSMMLPPVRVWLDGNTETPLAVLAALNLLVRFVTQGRISLFPDDDGSDGGNAAGGRGTSGGGKSAGLGTGTDDHNRQRTRVFPWLGVVACAVCLLVATMLSGCTPAQVEAFKAVPITIGIEGEHGTYGYSSKGGLSVAVKTPRVREEKRGIDVMVILEREWGAGRYAPGPLEQWPPIERKPRRLVLP